VWPYLIAFEHVPLWEHGIVEVRQVTPPPVRVGTQIHARRIYAGRETELRGEITDFEDGRRAAMDLRGGPISESRVEYAVEPSGPSASVVTYSAEGQLRGALRFPNPLLPAIGRAEARKNLRSLWRRILAGVDPQFEQRV
jgi:hypothetical protein